LSYSPVRLSNFGGRTDPGRPPLTSLPCEAYVYGRIHKTFCFQAVPFVFSCCEWSCNCAACIPSTAA